MTGKFFKTLRWEVVFAVILTLCAFSMWEMGASFAVAAEDGFEAEFEFEDELVVFPGGLQRVMRRVDGPAERYEAEDDPSTFFLSDGSAAVLEIDGRRRQKYVLIRNFSGGDEFTLTADGRNYAMKRAVSASGAKYEAENDPSTVLWSKGNEASLTVEGRDYLDYDVWRPDGEIWLPDQGLPIGLDWRVVSIAGTDVIPGSDVTITFRAGGKLDGKASINNYMLSWLSVGCKLLIADGMLTKMAGPANLMDQEERFLRFLTETTRFDFRREGLVLINRNGEESLLIPEYQYQEEGWQSDTKE
jgi:heat shock protein HslJ/membrane-bound inhibitor of C-type lysozyme